MKTSAKIMIAGVRSGSGKTAFTFSLLHKLSAMGKGVCSYKCGPDYIDPMFHRKVIGVKSRNLDLFFTDEEYCREQFDADDCDIKVVEGVMGIYDGIGGISKEGSSYHLATALKLPVILMVDAHGMGRSVGSLIEGFLRDDDQKLIKGIILNRTTQSIYDFAKGYIEKKYDVKLIGYIKNQKKELIDSRHLGLVLPDEIENIEKLIEDTSNLFFENVDINELLEIAKEDGEQSLKGSSLKGSDPVSKVFMGSDPKKVRIGIARDEAFCFYYEENIKLLEDLGAEIVYFSPLNDYYLRDDLDGMILGGGYPENYADKLSKNTSIMMDIRTAISGGLPILAECGGFMYLHDRIITKEGYEYYLAGAIEGDCYYTDRLVRFGYVSLNVNPDRGDLDKEFAPIKGHEFHYYESTNNGEDLISTKTSGKSYACSHFGKNYLMGFTHLYYPSNPDFAKWFIDKCYEYKHRQFK